MGPAVYLSSSTPLFVGEPLLPHVPVPSCGWTCDQVNEDSDGAISLLLLDRGTVHTLEKGLFCMPISKNSNPGLPQLPVPPQRASVYSGRK